jgi:amino acid transporter
MTDLSEIPPRLKRDVGLLPLFMVSMGSVIGSGWLLGTLNASKVAGPAAILSWVVGAVVLIGIALIYAELGAAYPISGSTARFTWMHSGTLGGFFAGTFSYLQAVAIAPIEVEASLGYLNAKWWHGLENSKGLLTGKGLVVGVLAMFLFAALNLIGVKWMAEGNTYAMIWKILVPVLTVIFIISKSFHGSNFSAGGGFAPFGVKGIFQALPLGVVFALEGFEQAAQLAGEARNPKRDIPIAVVGSMLCGAALYMALEVCFIGALSPHNLVHGWANPFGSAGSFGPYYTLATSVGLGWLGTVLIIDALISPGGTGLVYLASTSRLSYSLARVRFLPPVFANVNKRGVPWFSIGFAGIFGCILFLPFGSWAKLVGAITAASSYMYSFAPVAVVSLRKSDPDRERPYRVPFMNIIAPFSFVVSGLIVYWSGTTNLVKLDCAVIVFLVLYFVARRVDPTQAPIDFKAGAFAFPWIIGLTIFSIFGGSYVEGYSKVFGIKIGYHMGFWLDIILVAAFSLIIFFYAVNSRLGPERVNANVLEAVADAHEEDLTLGIAEPR